MAMGRAAELKVVVAVALVVVVMLGGGGGGKGVEAQSWCVARTNASDQALQSALDYACSSGADCAPIQSTGLCYLPNTCVAHASYAFNSYYQRKGEAPGSCDFAGTATIAMTDPSYGSCVYPSSPSNAGGTTSTPTPSTTTPSTTTPPTNTPTTSTPTTPTTTTGTPFTPTTTTGTPFTPTTTSPIYGLTPGSAVPTTDTSRAAFQHSISIVLPFSLLLLSLVFTTI